MQPFHGFVGCTQDDEAPLQFVSVLHMVLWQADETISELHHLIGALRAHEVHRHLDAALQVAHLVRTAGRDEERLVLELLDGPRADALLTCQQLESRLREEEVLVVDGVGHILHRGRLHDLAASVQALAVLRNSHAVPELVPVSHEECSELRHVLAREDVPHCARAPKLRGLGLHVLARPPLVHSRRCLQLVLLLTLAVNHD
mmetsp:Transcript_28340/g.79248  ORF Transcript_28340/g.79248 Transcript_28340/m.79248 type:complete len:202 (-) Transcript_28340:1784-2389(-)